jgi:hypothetical protein
MAANILIWPALPTRSTAHMKPIAESWTIHTMACANGAPQHVTGDNQHRCDRNLAWMLHMLTIYTLRLSCVTNLRVAFSELQSHTRYRHTCSALLSPKNRLYARCALSPTCRCLCLSNGQVHCCMLVNPPVVASQGGVLA